MKKLSATLIVILMLFTSSTQAQAASITYYQANNIANICSWGYNGGSRGPIMITKGTLTTNGNPQSVYMICMSGTEMVTNQTTGAYTDLLSGFNINNQYLKNVVKIINNEIPKGSNLFLAGHSLGGMIAQQVSADNSVKANYNILNTVTFGSPLISAGNREGIVRRLGDSSDIVPFLSAEGVILAPWQVAGLNREDGRYGKDFNGAHNKSYLRSDLWGSYDVTGEKYGNASFTFEGGTTKFYRSDY